MNCWKWIETPIQLFSFSFTKEYKFIFKFFMPGVQKYGRTARRKVLRAPGEEIFRRHEDES